MIPGAAPISDGRSAASRTIFHVYFYTRRSMTGCLAGRGYTAGKTRSFQTLNVRFRSTSAVATLFGDGSFIVPEAPGVCLVLEADNNVIGITHEDHVARGLVPSPALGPEVEHVVQVDVGEQR